MEILKFYSKTCGPCKVLERNLKHTDIVYKDIDVASEDGRALLDKYNIISVRTLVMIDCDKIDIRDSILSVEELNKWARTSL